MLAIIDGSRFYASSSVIYKPKLAHAPVLVTAGQGISIANSRRASQLQINKFEPIWDSIDRLRLHSGAVFRANFNTFSYLSDRFMTVIEQEVQHCPTLRYSVDEIFVNIEKLYSIGVSIEDFISQLRRKVYKETGVATGAGVAKTLLLTKAASWAAKNMAGMNGQCVLVTQSQIDQVLKAMPIGKTWGIGSRLTRHLTMEGITNAYQLKVCDPKVYQRKYSINVANIIHELNGITIYDISEPRGKKQQIWSTSSYRDRLRNEDDLFAELAHHTAEVFRKVRSQKSEAITISAFVSTSKHEACKPFSRKIELPLEYGLSDTSSAIKMFRERLVDLLPTSLHEQPIYKVGVGAPALLDCEHKQFSLFDTSDNKPELNSTMDALRSRFGSSAIKFASEKSEYSERQGNITFERLEDYFTDISDLICVKCI
ncbi:Nucleotidyltransferase/DNA polymerase involved in DNA repair [Vibrio nigripulchritudo FTn2]|uniref:Y-family DNA polymerase n=1 Tax=Vibrio nigripulchritudo TaxID=28173 RepID=UPI0003B21B89|nr:Nucleotidyltransferase/DNA polymerase involved in DNA repair [Vibrio nigripulchritudo]CCN40142.1 Nucleotidyltransferase/DNA polymerase involved in DNA repair [Vibrio nigripulchritudo FTn2]